MKLDALRSYCLKKQGKISEEFPFDEETLVFKVFGKMFLLTNVNQIPISMNLKCDPERAIELRERYDAITPGYHMNKKYWNTVIADGSLSDKLVYDLVDHSFDEVVKNLPLKLKTKTGAKGVKEKTKRR